MRLPLHAVSCLCLLMCHVAFAGTPSPALQSRVRAATFEVVMQKPEKDSLTYERPLPLDLLPFNERNDKYLSIGSAFAIGSNRFVTAVHVLAAGFHTQFGPLSLRGPDGSIHRIDQIYKYSQPRDFVVFSCIDCKAPSELKINRAPQLDTEVFAVGNALGEGIVIRDGLLTSMTPEARDGKWKWLRFSAAASPGNSGGPLLDNQGRVIGIVLRKSESENLNYALPISELLDAPENSGHLEIEMFYMLPVVDVRESGRRELDFPLPKSLEEVAETSNTFFETLHADLSNELKKKNAATLFPNGTGAAQLLYTNIPTQTLAIIARRPDGNWDAFSGQSPQSAQLEDNGYIASAEFQRDSLIKIRRPDSADPAKFYTDSQQYMDTLLKLWAWKRQVGREEVRVTSMGKAATDSVFVDDYGRKWQFRTWNCEYQDSVVLSLALPTPEGYVGIVTLANTAGQYDPLSDMRSMTSFAHVSYSGTLKQWQGYLALRDLHPSSFENLQVTIDYGKRFELRSPRFAFAYTHDQQKIQANSQFTLMFGFVKDGDRVRWEPTGISTVEDPAGRNALMLARRSAPATTLPQNFLTDWKNVVTRQHPFDARMDQNQGVMSIGGVYPVATAKPVNDEPAVLYTFFRAKQGQFKEKALQSELKQWMKGLQVSEKTGL
ncbi:MAG: trypsin-like peptidase domain-containing protein [Povalibacter sp.]